jgi:large subunit ribosomal protein L16
MQLVPRQTKYRRIQKGSMSGLSKAGNFITFGDFGMQTLDRAWITNQQIEACRIAINRHFARKGKVWIRVFPDKPISKKPAETRMGKGKGTPSQWVAVVRPGKILFEVANVSREDAQTALRLAAGKLGIRTRFVERVETV